MRRQILVVVALLSVGHDALGATLYPVIDLGTLPGGRNSAAYGINALGQVVGQTFNSSGSDDAFLYSGGKMTDLGTLLPAGSSFSQGTAINDKGQVTGQFTASDGNMHGFLYSNGTMTDLGGLPGHTASAGEILIEPSGINSSGQIVGEASYWGSPYSFLYSNGTMTDLGKFPGTHSQISQANAINDKGQVTGYSYTSSGEYHAYLYDGGRMTDLGVPAGFNGSSYGFAINNNGQVAGQATTTGKLDACLYSNGTMTDLGGLVVGGISQANGINDNGLVVGYAGVLGDNHAFLYRNGQMKDLNSLIVSGSGWTLENATAINDNGQIVGFGYHNGNFAAFLVNTPEPSTLVLLAIGAASLFGYGLWRKREAA